MIIVKWLWIALWYPFNFVLGLFGITFYFLSMVFDRLDVEFRIVQNAWRMTCFKGYSKTVMSLRKEKFNPTDTE